MWRFAREHSVAVIAMLLTLALVLFAPTDDPNPRLAQRDGLTIPSTPPPAVITPTFTDRTLDARLTHVHNQGDHILTGLNETLGPGACAFDYDNDGWVDLFAVGGSGDTQFYGRAHWWQTSADHHLYHNRGDGTFRDTTASAGIKGGTWGMGCATADLDNDGDQDLFVTNLGRNLLYRNNGDGTFSDISAEAGLAGEAWSTSVAMGDFDQDGLLDIYVVNYLNYVKGAHTFESYGGFDLGAMPGFNSQLYDGVANQLWRNKGDLRFDDVTATAGVGDASGRGLNASWLDVNHDRFPDLLVLNDGGFPHRLYINERNGRFSERSTAYQIAGVTPSAGAALGDVNKDGQTDIVLSSAAGMLPKLLLRSGEILPADDAEQRANAPFKDDGRLWHLADERSVVLEHWSAVFGDFNNDGWLDLFMANGLRTPDPLTTHIAQGQPKSLWLGRAQDGFQHIDVKLHPALNDRVASRGVAVADFDNNGTLDLYVSNNNELGQLLRNETSNGHFLGVTLNASHGNRDAIGARLLLKTATGIQQREIFGSGGFLSHSDRRVHFGLGRHTDPVSLTVTWPDGAQQTFNNIPIDRYVRIAQGDAQWELQPLLDSARVAASTLGIDSTATSVETNHAKLTTAPPEVERRVLLHTLQHSDDLPTRASIVAQVIRQPLPDDLMLLTTAAGDVAPELRMLAIEGLRQREDEMASRWLLRMFSDRDATVRIALANTYAFLFHEEEAMVHRKHLAVPYLVRMLDDDHVAVRVAAAGALGEAENFRGVFPLIEHLADANVEVQVAAACALGKIRERDAIGALRRTAENAQYDARVRAHALIALKRLNDDRLDALWSAIETEAFDSAESSRLTALFDMAHLIVTDRQDGIVYNPLQVAQRAQRWFARLRSADKVAFLAPTARLAYLNIINATMRSDAAADATLLMKDDDLAVRQRATVVYARLDVRR